MHAIHLTTGDCGERTAQKSELTTSIQLLHLAQQCLLGVLFLHHLPNIRRLLSLLPKSDRSSIHHESTFMVKKRPLNGHWNLNGDETGNWSNQRDIPRFHLLNCLHPFPSAFHSAPYILVKLWVDLWSGGTSSRLHWINRMVRMRRGFGSWWSEYFGCLKT